MNYKKSLRTRFYGWFRKGLFVTSLLSLVIYTSFPPLSPASVQISKTGNWPGSVQTVSAASGSDWTQEAHDAQRTGYTLEEPKEPWTLAWTFNGPDANGGIGGHLYNAPQDARTVTGGGNLYVPAGAQGLYALRQADGSQAWHVTAPARTWPMLYVG